MPKSQSHSYQHTQLSWAAFSFTLERLLLLPLLWTRVKQPVPPARRLERDDGFLALADDAAAESKADMACEEVDGGPLRRTLEIEDFGLTFEAGPAPEQHGRWRPLWFAGRTMPTSKIWNIAMLHGVREFKAKLELCFFKGMRLFFYGILAYRLYLLTTEGNRDFSEVTDIFTSVEANGVVNLVHLLSNVPATYLNLLFFAPLILSSILAAYAISKVLLFGEDELLKLLRKLEHVKGGWCRAYIREFIPIINQSSDIQKLEYLLRHDGRLNQHARMQGIQLLQRLATRAEKKVCDQVLSSLAKLSQLAPSTSKTLQRMGYSADDIAAVERQAEMAFLALKTKAQTAWRQPSRWQTIKASYHIILAKYYIWWLGQMDAVGWAVGFTTFNLFYHLFHLKLYYTFLSTVSDAINCPTRPGFQLGEGYADWSSDYTAECFQAVLDSFRIYNATEPLSNLLDNLDRFHLESQSFVLSFSDLVSFTELSTIMEQLYLRDAKIKLVQIGPFDQALDTQGFERFCYLMQHGISMLAIELDTLSSNYSRLLGSSLPPTLENYWVSIHKSSPGLLENMVINLNNTIVKNVSIYTYRSEYDDSDLIALGKSLPATIKRLSLFKDHRVQSLNNTAYNIFFSAIPYSLESLLLYGIGLSDANIATMNYFLSHSKQLKMLSIQSNRQISATGLNILLDIIPASLVTLDLSEILLDDQSITTITKKLPSTVRGLEISIGKIQFTNLRDFSEKILSRLTNYLGIDSGTFNANETQLIFSNLNKDLLGIKFYKAEINCNLLNSTYSQQSKLKNFYITYSKISSCIDHMKIFFSKYLESLVIGFNELETDEANKIVSYIPSKIESSPFEPRIYCSQNDNHRPLKPTHSDWEIAMPLNKNTIKNFAEKIPNELNSALIYNTEQFTSDQINTFFGNLKLTSHLKFLSLTPAIPSDISLSSETIKRLSCLPNSISIDTYRIKIHSNESTQLKDIYLRKKCETLLCHANLNPTEQCGIDIKNPSILLLPIWMNWYSLLAITAVVIALYTLYKSYQAYQKHSNTQTRPSMFSNRRKKTRNATDSRVELLDSAAPASLATR